MSAQVLSSAPCGSRPSLARAPRVGARGPARSCWARRAAAQDGSPGPELASSSFSSMDDEDFFDIWRDSPLRFLGYSNEVGEAFAAWLPAYGVPLSYAVAIAYVLTDTHDKHTRAHEGAKRDLHAAGHDPHTPGGRPHGLASWMAKERGLDTVIWQLLASVMIPGFTIHMIVALVTHLLAACTPDDPAAVPGLLAAAAAAGVDPADALQLGTRSVPTAVGLAAIPFIVEPIDEGVHTILDHSLRPTARHAVCSVAGGANAGLPMCEPDVMKRDYPVLEGEGPMGSWLSHESLDEFFSSWSDDEPWEPQWEPMLDSARLHVPDSIESDDVSDSISDALSAHLPQQQRPDDDDARPGASSAGGRGGRIVGATTVHDAVDCGNGAKPYDSGDASADEDEFCGVLCEFRREEHGAPHATHALGPAALSAILAVAPLAYVLLRSHFAAHPEDLPLL